MDNGTKKMGTSRAQTGKLSPFGLEFSNGPVLNPRFTRDIPTGSQMGSLNFGAYTMDVLSFPPINRANNRSIYDYCFK